MSGYTKLFSSILASTIWREDDATRIAWIKLLAMADRDGIVEASVPGLADLARVSVPVARAAIAKLSAPDEYSRAVPTASSIICTTAIPRTRDYRDLLIEDQIDYIAALEVDVVTYRDLLCHTLAALHDAVAERDILRGQLRINRRAMKRMAA